MEFRVQVSYDGDQVAGSRGREKYLQSPLTGGSNVRVKVTPVNDEPQPG